MNASNFEDTIRNLSDKALNKYIAQRRGWLLDMIRRNIRELSV